MYSPHTVNLNLSSTNLSVNISQLIHTQIESQLLSMNGNALLQPCVEKSVDPSWIQQLHSLSLHLILSGRKNDEGDVMECHFSRETLLFPRIQNTITILSPILEKYSSAPITINDLDYLLENRSDEEQIGILLSLGFSKHLFSIPLSLYKHKLVLCSAYQWTSKSNRQIEVDYLFELGVCDSFQNRLINSSSLRWPLLIEVRITIKSFTFLSFTST